MKTSLVELSGVISPSARGEPANDTRDNGWLMLEGVGSPAFADFRRPLAPIAPSPLIKSRRFIDPLRDPLCLCGECFSAPFHHRDTENHRVSQKRCGLSYLSASARTRSFEVVA